jgi:soluble P-type ATPase
MPVQIGSDNQGCYAKWGDQGHKYYYKCGNRVARDNARKKAVAQGVAIGEFVVDKISFDFDDTLTKASVRDTAKRYINKGVNVYVISARNEASGIYDITDKLGIPRSRVFATGSNDKKVEKIKSLGITKHYDNNSDVIKKIGSVGELVKLTSQEVFSEYIKFCKK